MLNITIGKSGRPVITGSGIYGYGVSNIIEVSGKQVSYNGENFSSYDSMINEFVNDGMTPYEAYKCAEAVI